jgi:uncharacterized membrane protein (DUF2068 family)
VKQEVKPAPPGTAKPSTFLPTLHYELLVCGLRGHALLGTDVAEVTEADGLVVRDDGNVRWYRCVRCDSWLPVDPPSNPARRRMPPREEIELPPRGKALRDKIVLRVIAVDRAFHFLILAVLAVAVFLIASHQEQLRQDFYRVLADIQGGVGGGPLQTEHHGLVGRLDELFSLKKGTLQLVGAGLAGLAVIEGVEALGLWYQRRWAEYLTFIVTTALIPLEVYELTATVSWFKVVALIVNLAIVVYLLMAKRLFGIRGGYAVEVAEREHSTGWDALQRSAPAASPSARAEGVG